MKEDIPGIIGGLKNALERGSDLEKAKSTFINAGYDAGDVEEAAKALMPFDLKKQIKVSQPLIPTTAIQKMEKPANIEKLAEKPLPVIPKPEMAEKPKKKGKLIRNILIGVAVVILLLIILLILSMLKAI